MKQTLTIPETFLGVGYTKDRAGFPLEAVRVPVPRPETDQVLIRVAASSLNPLEYKLAELNFLGRTPPVILGLDLSGIVVATGSAVRGVAVGDAVVAMADLNGDGGWVAGGGGEGSYGLRTNRRKVVFSGAADLANEAADAGYFVASRGESAETGLGGG